VSADAVGIAHERGAGDLPAVPAHGVQGPVSALIAQMVNRQVDEHGIVVWFDPERHYREVIGSLQLPDTTVATFDGSFLDLRYQVRGLMEGDTAPRLVLYVPAPDDETRDALVEFTAAGSVMKPSAPSSLRNTKLSVVAKRALAGAVDPEGLTELIRHVDERKIGLAALEKAGSKKAPVLLTEIFGAPDEDGIILAFIASDTLDPTLIERDAVATLALMLARTLSVSVEAGADPRDIRTAVHRYLLLTDLGCALRSALPETLASAPHATAEGERDRALDLVGRWRETHALRDSYVAAAEAGEHDLAIAPALKGLETDDLRECQTFPAVDRMLQSRTEEILSHGPAPDALSSVRQLMRDRSQDIWSRLPDRYPDVGPIWGLLDSVAAVLEEAGKPLGGSTMSVAAQIVSYTVPGGWYELDAAQRRMEEIWHRLDIEELDDRPALREAVAGARRRHTDVAGDRAECFVRSLSASHLERFGVAAQRQIWSQNVAPALLEGKVGYILVDALRFELGVELAEAVRAALGQCDLEVAVASFPTITPVGMASLLPGADRDFRIVEAGRSKLGVELDGARLSTREERLTYLGARCDGMVAVWIDDMLPHPRPALDKQLKSASLIVATSRDIDQLCESGMTRLARQTMGALLRDITRLTKKLASYGCRTIIIASDHGYLFGEEAGSDMKIAPPKGETIDLDRRMWIGRGGAKSDDYLRTTLNSTGAVSEFDLCVPWGLGIFDAVGAGEEYFHGGMSPQECILPVLTVRPEPGAETSTSKGIAWELTMTSLRITTLFCTVSVGGFETGLLELEPQRVRVEVVDGTQVIGRAVAAQYGLEPGTGDVLLMPSKGDPRRLEPTTVTLQLDARPKSPEVKIRMLDVATGRELKELAGVRVEMLSL
jgi:PglZ domain